MRSSGRALIVVGATAVLSAGLFAARLADAAAAQANAAAEVTFLSGGAERAPASNPSAWDTLAMGSKLNGGDRLRTKEKSRLEAKLKDGSLLRLSERSELKLEQVDVDKKDQKKKKVQARLFFGKVWAAVTDLFGDDSKFEVTTENAVAGVRGTRFEASRDQAGTTTVKVYGGKVLISNKPVYQVEGATKAKRVQVQGPQEISKQQWEELIAGAMQYVAVGVDGKLSGVQPFTLAQAGGDDDWEAWNSARDKAAGHP
jgi:hypothetical protein